MLTATLQMNVNGTSYDVPALEAERALLWYLRDSSVTIFRAQLDATRNPIGLFGRIAGPKLAFEGFSIPYDIPNIRIERVEDDPGIPTGYR